ncbi:MAG: hypothetical protein IPP29_11025 [Bacteroidetes bacterium]|nr:hypothetical protein [Bacteroidota bacterium]
MVQDDVGLRQLYYGKASTDWTAVTLSNTTSVQDALLSPDGNKLFVIPVNSNLVNVYNKSVIDWIYSSLESGYISGNVRNNKLALFQYSTGYKVLCGTYPTSTTPISNLYEVYNSANTITNAISIDNNCPVVTLLDPFSIISYRTIMAIEE